MGKQSFVRLGKEKTFSTALILAISMGSSQGFAQTKSQNGTPGTSIRLNGCDAQNYEREFRRQDATPFGKPLMAWTTADYSALRSRIVSCLDPYLAAPGRRKVYLASVDARLESYKKLQQRKRDVVRETNDEAFRARKIAEDKQASLDLWIKVANERLAQLRSYLDEAKTLPAVVGNYRKLNEIAAAAKQLPDPSSDPLVRDGSFRTNGRNLIGDATHNLFAIIDEKLRAIAAEELAKLQTEFKAQADIAARRYDDDINQLGFPKPYLNAIIYLVDGATTQAFITLRQLAAVLFSQKKIGIVSARMGDIYGLRTKTPGTPSTVYGFNLDGGDLFLSQYWEGDSGELLDNAYKKYLAGALLKKLVAWPTTWNADLAPVADKADKTRSQHVSGAASGGVTVPKFDPRFTPDEIAKRLDRLQEHKP